MIAPMVHHHARDDVANGLYGPTTTAETIASNEQPKVSTGSDTVVISGVIILGFVVITVGLIIGFCWMNKRTNQPASTFEQRFAAWEDTRKSLVTQCKKDFSATEDKYSKISSAIAQQRQRREALESFEMRINPSASAPLEQLEQQPKTQPPIAAPRLEEPTEQGRLEGIRIDLHDPQ